MKLLSVWFVEVNVKLQNKSLHLPHLYFTIPNLYTMQSTAFGQSQQCIWLVGLSSDSGLPFFFLKKKKKAQTLTYPWKSIPKLDR